MARCVPFPAASQLVNDSPTKLLSNSPTPSKMRSANRPATPYWISAAIGSLLSSPQFQLKHVNRRGEAGVTCVLISKNADFNEPP